MFNLVVVYTNEFIIDQSLIILIIHNTEDYVITNFCNLRLKNAWIVFVVCAEFTVSLGYWEWLVNGQVGVSHVCKLLKRNVINRSKL